jgi:hypothetical protein
MTMLAGSKLPLHTIIPTVQIRAKTTEPIFSRFDKGMAPLRAINEILTHDGSMRCRIP